MAELRSGATFYVTGNNALLTGDMTTRAVVCVLDADCERPERRSFEFEPRVDVPKRRGELVAAVLTMTRAYLAADEPKPDVHDYRFKHYCRFVRYPLIWLGMRDPCESLKWLEDRDPVAQKLAALLEAWHAFFGSEAVTVKEAVEAASSAFLAGSSAKAAACEALRDVMEEICGGRLSPTTIGKFISKYEQRYQNGLRFERHSTSNNRVRWQVRAVSQSKLAASTDEVGEVGEVVLQPTGESALENGCTTLLNGTSNGATTPIDVPPHPDHPDAPTEGADGAGGTLAPVEPMKNGANPVHKSNGTPAAGTVTFPTPGGKVKVVTKKGTKSNGKPGHDKELGAQPASGGNGVLPPTGSHVAAVAEPDNGGTPANG